VRSVEGAGILVGQGSDLWSDALGKECEDMGVDRIGLGELAGGLGEVTYLAGVRDDDRELSSYEGRGSGDLKAACGLHHHERRPDLTEPPDQLADPIGGIRYAPGLVRSSNRHIESRLRDVDTHEDRGTLQNEPPL